MGYVYYNIVISLYNAIRIVSLFLENMIVICIINNVLGTQLR